MDQVYLDNVKSTESNKKWAHIDIRGRNPNTLEHKEAVAKFRLFIGYDGLAHHHKTMNLTDHPDVRFLCN